MPVTFNEGHPHLALQLKRARDVKAFSNLNYPILPVGWLETID